MNITRERAEGLALLDAEALKAAMLKEEDCIKHYYPLKKLQEESGIEKEPKYWRLNDILRGIQIVFEKKYNVQRMNKVVLIDELYPLDLFI